VLLPIGEHVPGLEESVALGAVRDAAISCSAVLAGTLRLDVGTIGFLVDSDGQLRPSASRSCRRVRSRYWSARMQPPRTWCARRCGVARR